ncbi:MAG TPA: 5'-nucleotidase C-terminal domain-containing protein [Gemmatimonadales bacterium]|jgi:2',3'-cyclic-nucleotide 2'-phosphodiesterase/3'-nucleotidase|nr:5'-nucleotidase C-terminal domain-containing protein [Gemmatimonadales bacterium]
MLSLLFAASLAVAQAPDTAHVVIVATTDVHGRATAWDYLADRPAPGGLTRVATVVDSIRRRHPGQVVVLDAGDLLQGNPFAAWGAREGRRGPNPVIEAMNLAGYDAATPGNHDFDWGVPELERALTDAAFPYVSANLHTLPGDTLLVSPFRVLRRGSIRIGVTGFTTSGTMVWDRDQIRGRIRVARIESAARRTFETMRGSSDLVIALAHSGIGGGSTYDTTGVGAEHVAGSFASLPARPDLVVVGHSHGEIRDSAIGGVRYVQPRPWATGVAVVHVDLTAGAGGRWTVARMRSELVATRDVAPSALIEQRLAPAHDSVRAWLDTPVGVALAPMPGSASRAGPTPILDWVLEVQRRRAGAQLSAGPVFDLGAGFPADTIRRRHLRRLYPYENTLRSVRITGEQLRRYLERSVQYFQVDAAGRVTINPAMPGYDFDVVRGARYEVDLRQPVGSRIRNLSVGGRDVEPGQSFTMAVNSHRQTGAGGYSMLLGAPLVHDRGERMQSLLEEELGRGPLDPRAIPASEWRIVPEVSAVAVREIYDIAPEPLPRSASDTVVLRVLGTAGLHASLGSAAGAIDRTMDSLGVECGCPTLRLDAGGAATARAALPVLNRMGYAAAALAERDFDRSADSLRGRMVESSFPWIAANLFDSATGRRPAWVVPYLMIDTAGLRIAVLGYVDPETKARQAAERTRGLHFGGGELGLHDALGEVRQAKPALTILLAHAGAACEGLRCDGDLVQLAEELRGSGVGLIVGGDGGAPVETRIAGISVVSGGGPGALAVGDLVKTPAGGLEIRTRVVPVPDAPARPGTPLAAALDSFARRSDSLARRPQAQLKRPLARDGGQNALGGVLAEARRNLARADLGLVRNESIRSDLPAGPVTLAKLREVEPAGSELVRLTLTGAQVQSLIESAVTGPGGPSVHLAGGRIRYDPRAAAGRRVKEITLVGGRKLRPLDHYTLATDDSTAAGAGGFTVLAGRPVERVGLLDVEAAATYLRRLPQPVEVEASSAFQSTRR